MNIRILLTIIALACSSHSFAASPADAALVFETSDFAKATLYQGADAPRSPDETTHVQ